MIASSVMWFENKDWKGLKCEGCISVGFSENSIFHGTKVRAQEGSNVKDS